MTLCQKFIDYKYPEPAEMKKIITLNNNIFKLIKLEATEEFVILQLYQ